jgi:hypothetical protein
MKLSVNINTQAIKAALAECANQVPFAVSVALNKVAEKAKKEVQSEMQRVFDKPTPWVLNSLRVFKSSKTNLVSEVGFKDRNSADYRGEDTFRTMIAPHVESGKRRYKSMESRLMNIGMLPAGYNVVPGGAATRDSYGNMSQGQISQILNVLGTYTEAGYNKANAKTVMRLGKGTKKSVYGFEYWVNPVGSVSSGKHLLPGVYKRIRTGFGSSLKPVLVFVRQANYKKRLNFYEITTEVMHREFESEFATSFAEATRTAFLKTQAPLL